MTWVQTRPCDGLCCEVNPRFPTRDGKSCIYLDPVVSDKRCLIQRGDVVIPVDQISPALNNRTGREAFQETCVDWPHNIINPLQGESGDCCWQWISPDRPINPLLVQLRIEVGGHSGGDR